MVGRGGPRENDRYAERVFEADGPMFATGVDRNVRTRIEVLFDLAGFRPAWHAQAACRGKPQELFFPERGNSADVVDRARTICAACPLQVECCDAGPSEKDGTWADTSEPERRKLRRQRRRPAA
jgi:hypothetical protein